VTNYRLEPGEGIAGWVVENNRPAIVNDPVGDQRFTAKIDQAIGFQTLAILCVPLVVKGRPMGALEVLNKRQGIFTNDDLALLVSMAASLGVALNNANLYNEAQARVHINEVINEITASINAGHGLSETAKIISRQFRRLFDYDHISLSLVDDTKQNLRQWTFSEHGSIEYTNQVVRLENSELAQVIEHGRGYVRRDISEPEAEASRYPDSEIVLLDNVRSTVVIPLTAQAKPYGSLTVGNRWAGAFGQAELHLLEQLAPQLSIAIDKSLLIDQLEQRTTELQLLNRLSEMLVSTTDIGLIVETTLNMLPRVLPADVHGLIIAGEDGAYAGMAVPYGFKREKRTAQEILDTYLDISDGEEPVKVISTKCVPGNMPVSADWQPVTELSLPILTGQGARGVIYLASGTHENFSDNVLRIFSLIVSQISAAIANAQLFQQVEQERARLAAILASITDAVLVVNRNGQIVLDNPRAREVISANQSRSGQLLAESTSLDALIELFDSAIKGGKPTGEISLLDGRTFFANLSPVSTGKSDAVNWVATMHDISHFKELNQLKNDFVSSVSHDLKSPLSSILLAINLVAEAGAVTESQQELINTVDRQVRAMGQLIDDILDIGKIEAGIDMEMEPCGLAPIIGAVIEAFDPQATDKSIELSVSLADELPPVLANGMRLRQVFYNLIGNAIKYTPSAGKVHVKAYPAEDEIRIQIADTGVGIPPSDQPHIFEKFYRVRGEHATNVKGTGLGLAISKGIVERHHGRIWLESIFGEGSTFTVALPIYSANSS
jgi:signal transduction histidine kinase/putative methionine-R-sulfoxide reductase with GAF domain